MKRSFSALCLSAGLLWMSSLSSCGNQSEKTAAATPAPADSASAMQGPQPGGFADTIDGKATHLYTIQNAKIKALITDFGARLVALYVPDKSGNTTDVVAGFDSVKDYVATHTAYFGATIGRYGNRIGKGQFTIDGKQYQIPVNNGVNALHGGPKGFSDYVWSANKTSDSTIDFALLSPDMDMGFPGNLQVKVTYTVTSANGLQIDYTATTDKKTVVNLTNHAYYNLNGAGSGTILDHQIQIFAHQYTPIDTGLIPTGQLAVVHGTPFDFTLPATIGAHINDTSNDQIKAGHGYDHNFVVGDGKPKTTLRHAATVWGDKSGIVMDVYSLEPGLQFYTGNFMNGQHTMKYGKTDAYRTALCLETQHFPDSPNKPSWPSTMLEPGHTYHTTTVYNFSVKP